MSGVGQTERRTQERVVKLFSDSLGYDYLGNGARREGNSNVEVGLLTANLKARGYDDNLISRAVARLKSDAHSAVAATCTKRTRTCTACCGTG